ncbi:glycosyltransferase [Bordetella petrii]|uniref:Glycosyltransferase n=1 Tax=Bordetella petrii (strain ATCC BAA-461 / DSM 12804 / CCUG 43448 / CIP 107267 / Se-1111R) TaxID=340100 RepID=A9IHB6_BORPD|nr:glycosyltransferase [Bordetella petrii]
MPLRRVLLISNGYPDAAAREKGFILPDLKAFLAAGYDVSIAPVRAVRRLDPDLPYGVNVVHGLAAMYRPWHLTITLARLLRERFFWKEAKIAIRHGGCSNVLHFLKESIRVMSMMRFAKLGVYNVLYTYWFKGETAGIGFLPRDGSIRVTRAHGYDLYEERSNNKGYIPYREQTLPRLDGVILLSDQARNYVVERYPDTTAAFIVSPLGVLSEPNVTPPALADTIQLASCSYASANKRLPLIAQLAAILAERAWPRKVRWTHFGCSESQAGLRDLRLPANLVFEFHGEVSNSYIRNWYRQNAVSFFINLSLSEGQPVSIMEAMAFGIPIVATAVGGVPEMLRDGAGILLPKSPDLYSSVDEILGVLSSSERYRIMRNRALHAQRTFFNAEENGRRLVASIDLIAPRPERP